MNGSAAPRRVELFVPDRFEGLAEAGTGALKGIVSPVQETLGAIDARFAEMRAARRGALMILRGASGAGKSTFLNTVFLFRPEVVTERVPAGEDIAAILQATGPTDAPRILIIEGREAIGKISREALEAALHAINAFVRSEAGRDTLVVWPTNTDDLTEQLTELGTALGAEALFGVREPVERFAGPARKDFVAIAQNTVATLNEGASLAALGISEERAAQLAEEAETIGRYLALVRQALLENDEHVRRLLPAEQFRVWTVVIAGSDAEGDVAALTRGGHAAADVDRLITATGANIVKELKKQPETVGILGSVLDARIFNMDMVTVLAAARQYGDDQLHGLMSAAGMSTQSDAKAPERVSASELGLILGGSTLGTRKRGSKAGSETKQAFEKLAGIARDNDGACNRALGRALQDAGLIEDFEAEKGSGTELVFTSDLYCSLRDGEPVRLEVMWRNKTGRAEIANYVLTKLGNYGKAIDLLK